MEDQNTIGAWQSETFGPVTDGGKITVSRMFEEVVELCYAIGITQQELLHTVHKTMGNLVLKEMQGKNHRTSQAIAEEMADVGIMLMGAAHHQGINLQQEIDTKMVKNRNRNWYRRDDGRFQHEGD